MSELRPGSPERLAALKRRQEEAARRTAEPEALEDAPPPPKLSDLIQTAEPEDPYGLTEEEKQEIIAAAHRKVDAEKRAAAKKAFEQQALYDARREAEAIPPDEERQAWLKELVRIRISLPRLRTMSGRELRPDPILIDQNVFLDGQFYTVERHVAMYLEYLMSEQRKHVSQVDGRSRTYYNEMMGQMVYQGGIATGTGRPM